MNHMKDEQFRFTVIPSAPDSKTSYLRFFPLLTVSPAGQRCQLSLLILNVFFSPSPLYSQTPAVDLWEKWPLSFFSSLNSNIACVREWKTRLKNMQQEANWQEWMAEPEARPVAPTKEGSDSNSPAYSPTPRTFFFYYFFFFSTTFSLWP